MLKVLKIVFLFQLCLNILNAKEIYISENFIEHYCRDISKISISSIDNTKK